MTQPLSAIRASAAPASPIGDTQLRQLAHRLRQFRFTLLLHPPGLDAARLLRERLMPMLARRAGDQADSEPLPWQESRGDRLAVVADTLPTAREERRASGQAETAVFIDGLQALDAELLPAADGSPGDTRMLLVLANVADVLAAAGTDPAADHLLRTLSQIHWGLDPRVQGRQVRLLLAMDSDAWPLVDVLKLHALPVDEATESLEAG